MVFHQTTGSEYNESYISPVSIGRESIDPFRGVWYWKFWTRQQTIQIPNAQIRYLSLHNLYTKTFQDNPM